MNPLIQLKSAILPLLITLTLAPLAQAVPPLRPEDRGNGNSAAENVQALNLATTGINNTAHGWLSLFANTSGSINTAHGFSALYSNTTGGGNTANGYQALYSNTIGNRNTATGVNALFLAAGGVNLGSNNTANGFFALLNNTTGNDNTALGYQAGTSVSTANNVICIGANVAGADVSNTTWIGNVYGNATLNGQAAQVVVSVDGQLATNVSSQRFKKDIATMEKASEAILSLRPVTFHYKSDVKDFPQFGLIAEEVAKVNPALVLPDKGGKPYTVRYDAVNAMLLNEFLKEHKKTEQLEATVASLIATVKEQAAQIQKVSAQLAAASPSRGGLELSKAAPQTVLNDQ